MTQINNHVDWKGMSLWIIFHIFTSSHQMLVGCHWKHVSMSQISSTFLTMSTDLNTPLWSEQPQFIIEFWTPLISVLFHFFFFFFFFFLCQIYFSSRAKTWYFFSNFLFNFFFFQSSHCGLQYNNINNLASPLLFVYDY